jgi:mRNA interferase RelE/StbE
MSTFKVELSSHAQHFLKKVRPESRDRIIRKFKELASNPFPSDAKRVLGRKEKVFRIRVGDYRILYVVIYKKNAILISNVDKRERIY